MKLVTAAALMEKGQTWNLEKNKQERRQIVVCVCVCVCSQQYFCGALRSQAPKLAGKQCLVTAIQMVVYSFKKEKLQ